MSSIIVQFLPLLSVYTDRQTSDGCFIDRRMAGLASSRNELMTQLGGLMWLLHAVRSPLADLGFLEGGDLVNPSEH